MAATMSHLSRTLHVLALICVAAGLPTSALAQPSTYLMQVGTLGSAPGQFNEPYGVALDATGNVYVVDTQNHRVQEFTSTGGFIRLWGSQGNGDGQFQYPLGIAVAPNGNVYVTDE